MGSDLLLYVWNYNYSSWSMRAGLALRQTGAPFQELNLHSEGVDSAALKGLSPTGRFPLLKAAAEWIWDSLAIAEYLHEQFPRSRTLAQFERRARPRSRHGR